MLISYFRTPPKKVKNSYVPLFNHSVEEIEERKLFLKTQWEGIKTTSNKKRVFHTIQFQAIFGLIDEKTEKIASKVMKSKSGDEVK